MVGVIRKRVRSGRAVVQLSTSPFPTDKIVPGVLRPDRDVLFRRCDRNGTRLRLLPGGSRRKRGQKQGLNCLLSASGTRKWRRRPSDRGGILLILSTPLLSSSSLRLLLLWSLACRETNPSKGRNPRGSAPRAGILPSSVPATRPPDHRTESPEPGAPAFEPAQLDSRRPGYRPAPRSGTHGELPGAGGPRVSAGDGWWCARRSLEDESGGSRSCGSEPLRR